MRLRELDCPYSIRADPCESAPIRGSLSGQIRAAQVGTGEYSVDTRQTVLPPLRTMYLLLRSQKPSELKQEIDRKRRTS